MMIQQVAFRPRRLQLLAIAALAIAGVAIFTAPKINLSPTTPNVAPTVVVSSPNVRTLPPALRSTTTYVTGDLAGDASPSDIQRTAAREQELTARGCGSGMYVSGDMAGDASPAQIYATACDK